MKILFNSDMEKIRENCIRFKTDKIIVDGNKHDKDKIINNLTEQLLYLYMKLGVYE